MQIHTQLSKTYACFSPIHPGKSCTTTLAHVAPNCVETRPAWFACNTLKYKSLGVLELDLKLANGFIYIGAV